MKKPITLVLALLTFASVAQYNNTYDVNANTEKLTPAFVITNKKAESITVSYATDGSSPAQNYFILTKHDASGTVLYNNRIDPYFGPTDGFTNVEALIQTDDEDVLVSGYYYDNADHIEQPFLIKVDMYGNFKWARIYYVNKKPIVRSATNKISLCRVWDDTKENYFILASGDSEIDPGNGVANNVIKVNIDGKLLWSKKYYDTFANSFTTIREYPGDIEFSKDDKMYMMTGYRQDATATSSSRVMYFLGINNNGNVVTKFMTLASKSIPLDQDMVYNHEKHLFATVFTHAKSSYVQGISSQIGFISVDATLNIYFPKLLWHKEAVLHNGRSISLAGDHDYVLCAGVFDKANNVNNPAWLKVDIQGDPISRLHRYNVKDNVYFGHHATTYNPGSYDEEYVLVNEQKTDLRMIRTDVNGKACGVEQFEPYMEYYEPKEQYYVYDYKEQGDLKEYKVYEKLFYPHYRKCDGDGSSYRTTGMVEASASAQNNILLYPKAMQSGNAYMTLENNYGSDVKIEIRNIAGQLIVSENILTPGKHEIKVGDNLAPGMYLVNTYSTDGVLNTTTKILITE